MPTFFFCLQIKFKGTFQLDIYFQLLLHLEQKYFAAFACCREIKKARFRLEIKPF